MDPIFTPKELIKHGDQQLTIAWADGHSSTFDARYLRISCPCASCIHELTGEKMLDPSTVPGEVRIIQSDIVGNYALRFEFSDHHATGIYAFELLRKICPCCAHGTPSIN